jgi:hypothetical protein
LLQVLLQVAVAPVAGHMAAEPEVQEVACEALPWVSLAAVEEEE